MLAMSPQAVRSRLAILFSDNLRDALERKGISQKQLASMADVSENGISKILGGTRQIRFDTLEAICVALDVTPSELFGEQ